MFQKILKYSVFSVFFCAVFAFAATAEETVEPNKTLMYYLPSSALKNLTTVKPTDAYTVKSVVPEDGGGNPVSDIQKAHGIQTPSGLSVVGTDKGLTDHTKLDLETPSTVVIFPAKKRREPNVKTVEKPLMREPSEVQILPFVYPEKLRESLEKPREETVVAAPKPAKKKTVRKIIVKKVIRKPAEKPLDAAWAFTQLENCGGDVEKALTVLAKALDFKTLPENTTSCAVFDSVARYLKKCHPYPVVYYTPTNASTARDILLQKSVDLLTGHYTRQECSYLDLAKINFERAEFYKSKLSGVDFSDSYLNFVTVMDSDFSDSIFKNTFIDNALIQNVNLTGAYFKDAAVQNTHVQKTDLKMANFDSANLVNTQFRDVNLNAASLNNANLANTLFKNVQASKMTAYNANFTRAVFTDAVMNFLDAQNADFTNLVCNKCFFDGAKLQGAWFYEDLLVAASFENADLQNANFSKTRFEKTLNLKGANLYQADVSDVNLKLFTDMTPEQMRLLTANRATVFPDCMNCYDDMAHDLQLAQALRARPDFDRWACPVETCRDRLSGRASSHNLAVRAMTVLADDARDDDAKAWAVCTMSCIARADKGLAPSQIDVLTSYVRRRKPWTHDMILQRPEGQKGGVLDEDIAPDVQQILYILMSLSRQKDFGYDIDLSGTDLRAADLSGGDFEHFNFKGANLSMANMYGSTAASSARLFDDVVFDEYTVFPEGAQVFHTHLPPVAASVLAHTKALNVGWNMEAPVLKHWTTDGLKAAKYKQDFFWTEGDKTADNAVKSNERTRK